MKFMLRLIGVFAGLSVVETLVFLSRFARVGMHALIATGMFGILTILGWIVTFVAGPIAFVQLLRVRNSGRVAAIVLFGYMLAYYVFGAFMFREPHAPIAPIVFLCVGLIVLLGVLVLPFARRTCVGVLALKKLSE
jgi:hypothetical protein